MASELNSDMDVAKYESDTYSDKDTYEDDANNEQPSLQFVSKTPLEDHRVMQRTLKELMALLDSGNLVLDPDYQRQVVWETVRMTGLIDSLLENFYVPPIIFHKTREQDAEGRPKWTRVCVDGKQRLSSIMAFVDGNIPCHDNAGATWYFQTTSRHRTLRVLPDHVKKAFMDKKLICCEYTKLLPEQEEDLFARVQKGIQLSTAERLRATTGPWQTYAKAFEEDFPEVIKLARSQRSSGFRHTLLCFAQILEVLYPSSPDGKPKFVNPLTGVMSLMKNHSAFDAQSKAHFFRVFTTFKELVAQEPQAFRNNGYVHSKVFAPVELISCAVLIFMYGETRSNSLLLGDIRFLRCTLRQELQDLRLNKANWEVVWKFLEGLPDLKGTIQPGTTTSQMEDGSEEAPRQSDEDHDPADTPSAQRSATVEGILQPANRWPIRFPLFTPSKQQTSASPTTGGSVLPPNSFRRRSPTESKFYAPSDDSSSDDSSSDDEGLEVWNPPEPAPPNPVALPILPAENDEEETERQNLLASFQARSSTEPNPDTKQGLTHPLTDPASPSTKRKRAIPATEEQAKEARIRRHRSSSASGEEIVVKVEETERELRPVGQHAQPPSWEESPSSAIRVRG